MLNQAEWSEFSAHMVKRIYFWSWAWNGFRKLGPTHICRTGSDHEVLLHQSGKRLYLKQQSRESFRFPFALHSDLLPGDLTAVDSGQSWRPARCPQVQMCRVHGLHLCHIQVCLHVSSHTWLRLTDCQGVDLFHWECVRCDIYLPGRWILILSSTCMTSCKPAVKKGKPTCADSKTKAGFIHLRTNIVQHEEAIVNNYVDENESNYATAPLWWWANVCLILVKYLHLYKINAILAVLFCFVLLDI